MLKAKIREALLLSFPKFDQVFQVECSGVFIGTML
jgi:hypothetical protein